MSTTSKRLLEKRMIHEIEVLRPGLVHDGVGGFEEGFVSVAAGLKGRLFALSARERVLASRESAEVTHRLLMPTISDIRRGDHVRRTGDSDGEYDVVSTLQGGELGHHFRIELQRDQRGV